MKKMICLALLAMLFLFANSCHDEVGVDSELALKSGKLKKDVVTEMKSWFDGNRDVNKFVLLDYSNEIKWASAQVMEIDNSIVTEVKVKLKGNYKLMSEKDPSLNFDQRLLFIQKDGVVTSYMEYLISKRDQSYLQDTEKSSYLKRDGSFAGSITLENSNGEFSRIYYSTGDDNALRLKNVEETCYELVELFSDGSNRVVALFGCSPGTGSGEDPHGGGGTRIPNPTPISMVDTSNLESNYPCGYTVFKSFENFDNFISNTLKSTFGTSSTFNVTFIGTTLSNSTDGEFRGSKNVVTNINGAISSGNFTVKISDYVLNNSTKEYIAVTYAHETLHALIEYYNSNNPIQGKELFPIFYEWPSYEDGDHLIMANRYIDQMTDIVQQINPNMPILDAKCLAWNGLQGTRTYDLQRSNFDQINGAGAWDRKMAEVNSGERSGSSIIGTKCLK